MREAITRYENAGGPAWRDGSFYLSFVMFGYAAMVQGILHRQVVGADANKTIAHTQQRVAILAQKARAILATDAHELS